MTNSKISSIKPLLKIPKLLIFAFLIASFIGFFDATYITAKQYLGTPFNCFINGCEDVIASQYATIGNIPTALLGVIYYLIIFIFVVAYLDTKKRFFINFIAKFVVVGLIASIWFLFVQFFIIKALCLYCLISAGVSIILFILGILVIKSKNISS